MRQLQILRADIESHESVDSAMSRLQELRILDEIPDTLILVQHPEVVTLGPKAERDGALSDTTAWLRRSRPSLPLQVSLRPYDMI